MSNPFPTSVTHTVTDRIVTFHSNPGKKKALQEHFENVREIKNLMARYAYSRLALLEDSEFQKVGYQLFREHSLPALLQNVLTEWELQKLFHSVVCEHTRTHRDQVLTNCKFRIGKFDSSKKRNLFSYGNLATLLNGLRFRKVPDGIADVPTKLRSAWKQYSQKFSQERLIRLLKQHQENVLHRIHPVEYQTGSYIKTACFNKRSAKPTWHSYWMRNDNGHKFQDWYRLKTPQWMLHLPLSVNWRYHKKDYDLAKEHWITLNRKGEVSVSLVHDRMDDFMEPKTAIGLDCNVKTNLFATSDGVFHSLEDGWIERHEKKIRLLEKKGFQHLDEQDQILLRRLTRNRESVIRERIQSFLLQSKEKGITDVVLENLTLTLSGGFSRKMNRLLRFLRFGTIRTWMREQAHKLGMRIHDLPAAFSSQACTHCGNVEVGNRNQQQFCCLVCGTKEHADTHGGSSMLWLFEQLRDVLVSNGFLDRNGFGEYTATAKSRSQYHFLKSYYQEGKTKTSCIQGGRLDLTAVVG